MNEHLTSTQICEWIAGERSAKNRRHLAECSRCSAELSGFEGSLSEFGDAVREFARTAAPAAVRPVAAAASWQVAVAAVAGVVVALVPLYWSGDVKTEIARLEDVQLLEHIDMQLSRAVPATMEPLLELMVEEQNGKDGLE